MNTLLTAPRLYDVPGRSAALFVLTSKTSLWDAVNPFVTEDEGFNITQAVDRLSEDYTLDEDDYRLLRLAAALYMHDLDADLNVSVAELCQIRDVESYAIAMDAISLCREGILRLSG